MNGMESLRQIAEQLPQPLWGRWERKEQLASGTDCIMYRLESKRMNRTETAVLKIVPLTASRTYYNDEQKQAQITRAKERTEQESDMLYQMQDCPNIVTYQDEELQPLTKDGQLEGYAYLIRMEQLDCLTDLIRSRKYDLTESNVRKLAADIAQALDYAHSLGIMHRGIQPDKIFISGKGIAKLGGFRIPTRTGVIRAIQDSDAYIAPEIVYAKGAAAFTPQADIYSLGVCLYQLMNGMYLPFEKECDLDEAWELRMNGEPFPQLGSVSSDFAAVIRKACAFDPAERYQSAADLAGDLIFRRKPAQSADTGRESEEEAGLPEPAASEPVTKRAAFFAAEDELTEPETIAEPEPEAVAEPEPEAVAEPEPEAVAEPEPEAVAEQQGPAVPRTAEEIRAEQEAERAVFVMPQFTETLEDISMQMRWERSRVPDSLPQNPDEKPAPLPEAESTEEFEIKGSTLMHYHGRDERVTLPEGITRIGKSAFAGNRTIRAVQLPDSLQRIEEHAFSSCTSLEEVRFPSALRSINNEAFRGCISLKAAHFSGSLSQIGASAFSGCRSMNTVVLDCPLETIGYDAFYDCSRLTEIAVGKQSYAFRSIDGVLFDYDGKHLLLYPAGRQDPDYIVPDSTCTIGDSAFSGCDYLERVKLSANVRQIGSSAFRNCMRLREIIFPENLETIKNCAFQNCVSLTRARLPHWMAYIGAYAFSGCRQLAEVQLPAKLTELCMGIFEYCASLTQLKLTEGIVKIGEKAFLSSGLTELFVPYSVSTVEHRAFACCPSLRYIFLSARIYQIASDAFEKHSSSLTVYGILNSRVADYAEENKLRFEPMFALSGGSGSQVLHKYYGVFRDISIPPEVNVISGHAFQDCKSLHSIVLPSGIGEIGEEAFRSCTNLEYVSMTNLVMQIGPNAFTDCESLRELKIVDMSQSYPPKVQRKIHRNFYRVLKEIRPESAEKYAKKYNAGTRNSLFDIGFTRQAEKEMQEHVAQLADEYENTVLLQALLALIRSEMEKSERKFIQIELFGDCMITTGVMAGKTAIRRFMYRDLDAGVRLLPNANHIQACAEAIIRELGGIYGLAPIQNKDSVLIQPVLTSPRPAKSNA